MVGCTYHVGDYGSNCFRSLAMVDSGFGLGLAMILFFSALCVGAARAKWAAAMLIAAGILWFWGLRREEGAWSLLGWLGVVVSAAGLLVYIEAVKREILGAIGGPSKAERQGE